MSNILQSNIVMSKINVIIPLCGKGSRFTKTHQTIKPLIKVYNKEIIMHLMDSLYQYEHERSVNMSIYIIINKNTNQTGIQKLVQTKYPNVNFVDIIDETGGAAETVLIGLNMIKHKMTNNDSTNKDSTNNSILILDGDSFYTIDIIKQFTQSKHNAISYFNDTGTLAQYSYITLNNQEPQSNRVMKIVEKDKIIDGSKIKIGDKLIGLASNGIHSNGYSLARKVFSQGQQKKLAHELLKPTRIYVKPVLDIIKNVNVKGISHITGGAFYGKIPRIIPKGMSALIDKKSWPVPKIFKMIQKNGNVEEKEMYKTFNMGIGMVLVLSVKDIIKAKKILAKYRLKSWVIGEIVKGQMKTQFTERKRS